MHDVMKYVYFRRKNMMPQKTPPPNLPGQRKSKLRKKKRNALQQLTKEFAKVKSSFTKADQLISMIKVSHFLTIKCKKS